MTQLIIYPNPQNRVVIVSPATDADIADVAAAVVPENTPHRIINSDDLPPASEWLWSDDGDIHAAPIPGEAINAERDRRIEQGKTFALSTGKQISLRGDNTTKENLQALAFAASMRVAQGQGAVITLFRDNTDYVYELTQLEIIELWSRSAEFVSKMFQAGWFIKDAPSIPKDYTDDKYWKDA
jgi:hypothetical protein